MREYSWVGIFHLISMRRNIDVFVGNILIKIEYWK